MKSPAHLQMNCSEKEAAPSINPFPLDPIPSPNCSAVEDFFTKEPITALKNLDNTVLDFLQLFPSTPWPQSSSGSKDRSPNFPASRYLGHDPRLSPRFSMPDLPTDLSLIHKNREPVQNANEIIHDLSTKKADSSAPRTPTQQLLPPTLPMPPNPQLEMDTLQSGGDLTIKATDPLDMLTDPQAFLVTPSRTSDHQNIEKVGFDLSGHLHMHHSTHHHVTNSSCFQYAYQFSKYGNFESLDQPISSRTIYSPRSASYYNSSHQNWMSMIHNSHHQV